MGMRLVLVTATFAVAANSGCTRAAFRSDLFTLDVSGLTIPVMLSRGKQSRGTGIIETSTGTESNELTWTVPGTGAVRAVTLSVTTLEFSEAGPSPQFRSQIAKGDRWVQIEHIDFVATNAERPHLRSRKRSMELSATAHK